MKKRLKRQLMACFLAVTMVAGSLLPGFANSASAAINEEWDPLAEWLPGNGQSFDPVGDLLKGMTNNTPSYGNGSSPLSQAGDAAPTLPEEPVDIATGALVFDEKDFSYPTLGPTLEVDRSYSSEHPDQLTMFGYGWSIPQDRYLQMFDQFTITDFQADGSRDNYMFHKDQAEEEVIVESYDGDDKIYYPLHLGHYTAEDADSKKTLTRRGADDYLLVDEATGMRYAFHGYKAPWRAGQKKYAGKLLRYADRTNFVIWVSYDESGRITRFKGNLTPSLTFAYQGDSELVDSVTDYGGLKYLYDYDGAKNLTKITRPDGSILEMTYDGAHRITSRTENGVKTDYEYQNGKVSAIKDALGRVLWSYQHNGNTVTRTSPDGITSTFTINNEKVTKRVDSSGVTYNFDDDGNITSIVTSKGTTSLAYNEKGNMIKRTDPLGRVTELFYTDPDYAEKPSKVVEAGGATLEYDYNAKGKLLSVTDALHRKTVLTLDDGWFVVAEQTDASNRKTSYLYNNYAQPVYVKDAKEQATTSKYDNSMRLTQVNYPGGVTLNLEYQGGNRNPSVIKGPLGIQQRFEYDKGRLRKSIDANGQATEYIYNTLGQVEKKIGPDNQITDYSYTKAGRIDSLKYPDGRTVHYEWGSKGLLQKKSGTGIITTEYEYDIYGQVTKLITPKGTTEYVRDDLGRVTSMIDPRLNETKYIYNAAGLVETMEDAKGNKAHFTYDALGQLKEKKDPTEGITTYTYDDFGNVTSVLDPQGRKYEYTYDNIGELEKAIDPLGRTTDYDTEYTASGRKVTVTFGKLKTVSEYDLAGRLVKQTNPELEATSYTYDDNGQLLEVTDPMNKVTKLTYDPFGRVESTTDPKGNTYSFTYDEAGRIATVTDPKLHTVEYQYDLKQRTTKLIKDKLPAEEGQDAKEVFELFQYDEIGNLVEQTNARGNKTQYQYDAANNLTHVITPKGTMEYKYDELNQLEEEIDPLKNSSSYTYDKLGRVLTVTDKAGEVTSYEYDPLGVYVIEKLPNGKTNRVEYNKVGQVTKTVDAEGGVTDFQYDELGRLEKKINPRQHSVTYQYDNVGRLLKMIDPKTYETSFTYDDNGNLKTRTNPMGYKWEYVYDDGNLLTQMIDPKQQISSFDYDKNDNLVKYVDALHRETLFSYDPHNRLIGKQDAEGFKSSYAYDAEGNLTQEMDDQGNAAEYTYDEINRLIAEKNREGLVTETVYDAVGNVLATIDGNKKKTQYQYDPMGRLTEVLDAMNNKTFYRYNDKQDTMEQQDALGHITKWTFDGLGRVKTEKGADEALTKFEYDKMGNLTARIDAANKRTDYEYDSRQLLTSIKSPSGVTASFAYDQVGRLTQASNPALTEAYTYDELDRIKSITNVGLSKTFTFDYDAVGNKTKSIDSDGLITAYTYDKRDNIKTVTDPEGYITTYGYNQNNQVTNIQGGDLTTTAIAYDKNGHKKSIETNTTTGLLSKLNYIYDGVGNILSQTEEDGAVTSYKYDDLYRLVEAQYPKAKIETIRNTYYTPPLDKLYPEGADGSGDIDTTAPTFPDSSTPQMSTHLPAAGGNGNGGGKDKDPAPSNPTPSAPTPGNGNGGGNGGGGGGNGGGQDNGGSNGNGGGNGGNGGGQGNRGSNGNGRGNGGGNDGTHGNGNGKGNGHAYGKYKDRYGTETGDTADYSEDLGYPANYVPEDPDFFLNPVSKVNYTYDAVGNRTSMTDDFGVVNYTYDQANRLLTAGGDNYNYDTVGNLVSKTSPYGGVNYSYNDDNMLSQVSYVDGTYVKYDYDAFGRKTFREEQYFDLNGPGASMGQGDGNSNGNGYGRDNNPGQGNAYGHDKNTPSNGNSNGNGKSNGKGNGNAGGNGKGQGNGNSGNSGEVGSDNRITNYQLKKEQTRFFYEDNSLLHEYNGDGDSLAHYYRGADDQVISRKMFGFQGRKEQGYLGNLRDRGHQLFYHYDAMGNALDLTDHLGSEVLKYRYDAFGGVFTQLWTPYNQVGLTGKSYDIKASLMDYSARWYSPADGRFTTQDTWTGNMTQPQTLNRYAYVLNNPINLIDPTGHSPCPADGDCGYSPPDNSGGSSGGGTGGGGEVIILPPPIDFEEWMDIQLRHQNMYGAAGENSAGTSYASIKRVDNEGYNDHLRKLDLVYGILSFLPNPASHTGEDYRYDYYDGDSLMQSSASELQTRFNDMYKNSQIDQLCDQIVNSKDPNINITQFSACNASAFRKAYDPTPVAVVSGVYTGVKVVGEVATATIGSKLSVTQNKETVETKYYTDEGELIWPSNNGFHNTPVDELLNPGTKIDRYGEPRGRFVSPEGTPFSARALPASSKDAPYHVYEVVKPIQVKAGRAEPWFGEPGMGTQYLFDKPISQLIKQGFLREVK